MKRAQPLKRKSRLKSVNRERTAKRKARDFGEYAEHIRQLPCAAWSNVRQDCAWPVGRLGTARKLWVWQTAEAAHVKSRGAGGHAEANLVPLCLGHHHELHTIGRRSFEKKHGLDLGAIAADLWGRYQEERGAA